MLPIFPPSDRLPDDLKIAISKNLRSALAFSILLLPQTFSEEDLYETIAGLSFMGDYRVGLAENPNKVRNIVFSGNNVEHFRSLYHDSIEYFLRAGLIRRVDTKFEVPFRKNPLERFSIFLNSNCREVLVSGPSHAPKPKSDPKPETLNPKPQARNPKP